MPFNMSTKELRITEYDGGGDNVTATYVQSQTGGSQALSRVDAIVSGLAFRQRQC